MIVRYIGAANMARTSPRLISRTHLSLRPLHCADSQNCNKQFSKSIYADGYRVFDRCMNISNGFSSREHDWFRPMSGGNETQRKQTIINHGLLNIIIFYTVSPAAHSSASPTTAISAAIRNSMTKFDSDCERASCLAPAFDNGQQNC